jgi:tetratricopeptide (TPR) repeat protein
MRRILIILGFSLCGLSCFGQSADKELKEGILKCMLRDYRSAVTILNRVITNNPDSFEAFYYRGIAKTELRDYKSAIPDFTRAIELNPGKVETYYERGLARRKSGDYSGSKTDFAKAKELNPASSPSDYHEGHRPGFTLSDTIFYNSLRNTTREKFLSKYAAPDSVDVFDKRGFDLYSFFYFHDHDTCWIYFTGNSLQTIMYQNLFGNWHVIEY